MSANLRTILVGLLLAGATITGVLNGVRTYLEDRRELLVVLARRASEQGPAKDDPAGVPRLPGSLHGNTLGNPPLPRLPSSGGAQPPLGSGQGTPPPPPRTRPKDRNALTLEAHHLFLQGELWPAESLLLTIRDGTDETEERELARIQLFRKLTRNIRADESCEGVGLTRLRLKDGTNLVVHVVNELDGQLLYRLGNGSMAQIPLEEIESRRAITPEEHRRELRTELERKVRDAGDSALGLWWAAVYAAEQRLGPELVRSLDAALRAKGAQVVLDAFGSEESMELWIYAYDVVFVRPEPSASVASGASAREEWPADQTYALYEEALQRYREGIRNANRQALEQAEKLLREANAIVGEHLEACPEDSEAEQLAIQITLLRHDILKQTSLKGL